jgi:hypothetical protein
MSYRVNMNNKLIFMEVIDWIALVFFVNDAIVFYQIKTEVYNYSDKDVKFYLFLIFQVIISFILYLLIKFKFFILLI